MTLGSLSAQSFIGKLNPFPDGNNSVTQADTLKILAIMVSFQEDRDDATFGNGKFGSIYSADYGNSILDPLPHDKTYFENHLEFLHSYFSSVSKGNLTIQFNVLPDTFSVSKTMRNYSPPNNSNDFLPLGEFSKEAWSIASSLYPNIKYSDYDFFIIFHAGVGRDISLPGSLGNERDLPSVYLSDAALKSIFPNDLTGLPINRFGKYNTAIIPETESRELSSLTGKVLFEISINGLLAATVASHIGLPDLFNTETGLSAIGRFGLMDGQSIFAYNGTFPPEPSAWEKIYLGWAEPVELQPGDYDLSLAANLAASVLDTVILKVPINSSEYYLIENRARDVNNNGSTITYKIGNGVFRKIFPNDTTGFRSFDTDSLIGVVINVDEFDWALPGNGILIWHIDEKVIAENLAANTINNNKFKRGVDLEEADGIQDIGEKFLTIFGDEVIGEGTDEDFWFSGNEADLYKNRFSKSTRPNTNTNSGANSLITIKDFSAIGNVMRFKVAYGDSTLKPIFSSKLYFNEKVKELSVAYDGQFKYFNLLVDSSLKVYGNDTELRTISAFSNYKTPSIYFNNTLFTFGVLGDRLSSYLVSGSQNYFGQISNGINFTSAPIVRPSLTESIRIHIGTADGKIQTYSSGSLPQTNPSLISSALIDSTVSIVKLANNESQLAAIGKANATNGKSIFTFVNEFSHSFQSETPIDLILTQDGLNNYKAVVLTDENQFYIFSKAGLENNFKINTDYDITSFSLVDLKKDGNIYILFSNGEKLEARNFSGALADNYPFIEPDGDKFIFSPLAADIEGSENSELIAMTKKGKIYAFDGPSLRIINGFPISSGNTLSAFPILFAEREKPALALVDQNNQFSAWEVGPAFGIVYWLEKNGDNLNSSFVPAAENKFASNEFFPKSKAYNYPNPVYDGVTYIRYFVSEDSKVNIKIFDLAGDFVAEMSSDASGGMDNETVWDVSSIQSGVYIARIEAVSQSGKSESNTIKIAVVK